MRQRHAGRASDNDSKDVRGAVVVDEGRPRLGTQRRRERPIEPGLTTVCDLVYVMRRVGVETGRHGQQLLHGDTPLPLVPPEELSAEDFAQGRLDRQQPVGDRNTCQRRQDALRHRVDVAEVGGAAVAEVAFELEVLRNAHGAVTRSTPPRPLTRRCP